MLLNKDIFLLTFDEKEMKKGSKLYSILKSKCPHCHEGEFFEGSPFRGKVAEHCNKCGQKFSKEPGFYQGSYYVTYSLGVAVFVINWIIIALVVKNNIFDIVIIAAPIALLLLSPFMFPLSKIIWANLFFSYKEKLNEKSNSK